MSKPATLDFEAMTLEEHIAYRTEHRAAMREHKAAIAAGRDAYERKVEEDNMSRLGFGRKATRFEPDGAALEVKGQGQGQGGDA